MPENMPSPFTPFSQKLAMARYDKKKFGIGFKGGPAFWFVRERNGQPLDNADEILLANIVAAYNEKCK
ncbi:hypothetical protein [Sporomusa sphaeroides]|uniref:Uncharacterized protein n=1 Tax=Sporomusa sphaeroides DSM 2875 TaxID=1337886 RepID=A0ABP2C7X9_9FIRM|nr:hypothetical protein [Sporomusa sphaeroides]OLS56410.1 hypothetical protein SPSPH_28030 [Sporomusa sphaeroides DSM 2875]CVK18505.1 hypothetical protein SSPH_01143 [Sporomusa sphaeroides DSM 2875]